ncbi:MAG TPA: hypothetical protein GXZ98_08485 [Firmicutes bacterium]|nr:hypothetical protein [Bacillota bacterium]
MPKVFLFGYYGFGNLGDELLRAYYTNLLRDHFPASQLFVLLHSDQAPKEKEATGYTAVNRWCLWRLSRLMAPGDLLLGGGGSIFQDLTSQRSLLYYLALLHLARRRRVAIILAGQGIGPLSPWGQKVAGPVLNQAAIITCRDQESFTALQEMGVKNPLLYPGVDPLWDYPVPPLPTVAASGAASRVVGYIFRPGDLQTKKTLLKALNARFGGLRLLVFAPGDEQPAQRLAGELGLAPPQTIGNLADFMTLVPEQSIIISQRLHGLLLAARYGLPGVGLSDDPKIHAFCRQMQWPCWGWSEQGLCAKVITAVASGVSGGDGVTQRIRRQTAGMAQKGEEDRQWLLQQLRTVLPGR